MRKPNLTSILQLAVVLSVLVGLLLCLNGCKKPADSGSNTTTNTPTGTTAPQGNTNPSDATKPSDVTKPSDSTKPSEVTEPTNVTSPTEETPPADCVHELGNWIVDKASTCTTEGSRYKECSLCKYKIETEVIPIVPHSASAWLVHKEATCTAEGIQYQECVQCKMVLARIIVSKADHKTYAIKGYDATLNTPGLTQGYLCSKCGSTVQDQFSISPLWITRVTYEVNADGKSCTLTGLVNKNDEEMILPDTINGFTVTAIRTGAFSGCTKLKTVYLPDSVAKIGAEAFKGCTALTNITYEGTTLQWITVAKGTDWDVNTGNFNIYCSNNHLSK